MSKELESSEERRLEEKWSCERRLKLIGELLDKERSKPGLPLMSDVLHLYNQVYFLAVQPAKFLELNKRNFDED